MNFYSYLTFELIANFTSSFQFRAISSSFWSWSTSSSMESPTISRHAQPVGHDCLTINIIWKIKILTSKRGSSPSSNIFPTLAMPRHSDVVLLHRPVNTVRWHICSGSSTGCWITDSMPTSISMNDHSIGWERKEQMLTSLESPSRPAWRIRVNQSCPSHPSTGGTIMISLIKIVLQVIRSFEPGQRCNQICYDNRYFKALI